MYRVVHIFYDMEDKNKHVYRVNDIFPHDGRKISKKRLEELTSTKNKIGEVLIELVDEDVLNKDLTDLENDEENTSNEDNDSNEGDENTSDEDNDSNEDDGLVE